MKIELINSNPILKLTFEFSLMVVEYCSLLETERKFVIANQLLKSGTSIGANAMEAQNAESKADFIINLKLRLKKVKKPNTGFYFVNLLHSFRIVIP